MTGPLDDRAPSNLAVNPRAPSIFAVLTPLVLKWRLVLGLPVGAAATAALFLLIVHPTYTATTTFAPIASGQSAALQSGLAGLATQFGLNVGSAGSISPDFFAEVLRSRELLRATLLSQFDDPPRASSPRTLLDLLNIRGKTEGDRLDKGIRHLDGATAERVDRRTGIVTLSVKARSPALAAAVANRMVDLLNRFNLEQLQSQSRARRRFSEERRAEAEAELREAEAQQLKFLQTNRRYADSPLLSFEESRLARQVQLRQEVYQTLTREYEEARIAEVRDTPLLTTIDAAVPPDRRSFPPRKVIVLLAMLAGSLSALGLVYLAEYRRAAQFEDPSQYHLFLQAWNDAKAQLRAALRIGQTR